MAFESFFRPICRYVGDNETVNIKLSSIVLPSVLVLFHYFATNASLMYDLKLGYCDTLIV